MTSFIEAYFGRVRAALETVDLAKVEQAIQWFAEARDQGRQIFVCGNGGSASNASHFVTEVVKGASQGHARRFRILALTESISTITAYANDAGYDCVFAEQLKNFAQPGDLVVGLSSTGNSPSVLRAIEYANSIGCRTIGMTGFDGGQLGPLVQLHLHVNEPHTGRSEEAHLVICHMISYYFMERA
jgi:D-sedoheptulose 7-phosphate isomerase